MKKQQLSPAIINSLKEALAQIYWYKAGLKSFLINSLRDSSIVLKLDWSQPKRVSVNVLIEFLISDEDKYQTHILQLIIDVLEITDYSHLEKLEDGQLKSGNAKKSVLALKKLFKPFQNLVEDKERKKLNKEKFITNLATKKELSKKIEELKEEYILLIAEENPRKRGKLLESFMKKMFDFYDIDAKASFKLKGEEIDGAFTYEGTEYLFEAKWHKQRIQPKYLNNFHVKITDKLDNTLGLFLSINGFTENVILKRSNSTPKIILMDGEDLFFVLDGRIDLPTLLTRKRKFAAQTGKIYLPVKEILNNL